MNRIKNILLVTTFILSTSYVFAIPKFSDNTKKVPPSPIYKKTIIVPQGYIINTTIKENIDCNKIIPSDNIEVSINNDLIYKGNIVAPEGSIILGKITKKYENDNSCSIKAKLTNIISPDGINIPISAVFIEENATGYINAFNNGKLFENNNADIILKQPITYVPIK